MLCSLAMKRRRSDMPALHLCNYVERFIPPEAQGVNRKPTPVGVSLLLKRYTIIGGCRQRGRRPGCRAAPRRWRSQAVSRAARSTMRVPVPTSGLGMTVERGRDDRFSRPRPRLCRQRSIGYIRSRRIIPSGPTRVGPGRSGHPELQAAPGTCYFSFRLLNSPLDRR